MFFSSSPIARLLFCHSLSIYRVNLLCDQGSLRKKIGTIPQEPELFHRTIMENIKFARIGASDEEVIDAAKKARCSGLISLNTFIG